MRLLLKIVSLIGIWGILALPSFAATDPCLLSISSGEPYWQQVIDPVVQKTFIDATTINAHTVEPEELLPHPTYAPFVWLTKDQRGLIINRAFFNNIYPISAIPIRAGQEIYLTTLNDRSFSAVSARDIALFFIRSDLISAHGTQFPNTTTADFCLDQELDNERTYEAHFSGRSFDYCTNECLYRVLDFSVRINKNTGAVHVLGPQDHDASPPLSSTDEIPWEQVGFGLGFFSVFFVYLALALRSLAKKYNTPRRWRVWIPIAQWFLLVDIARKPRWWKWHILVPLLFLIVLGVFAPMPGPWGVAVGLLMVGTFFFQQILVALCTIAIAKSQRCPLATIYGLFMGFGQPIGAIMFGMLAWRKAPTPLPPPQSSWRDLFRFSTRISFKDHE